MATGVTKLRPTDESRPPHINDEEWEARIKLAAMYRIFDHLGWSLMIFNHITVRAPGPEHHFLINPFGLRYDEVTASNLVKIDLDGNKVEESPWDVNPAGFVIHSAIHRSVPDAMCVAHTHTREGLAVSCKKDGLSNTNFYSAMLYPYIAYHDFEGVTLRLDEQDRLLASMGDKPLMILRNHGLLVLGRTVEETFMRMWTLQLACEAQVTAEALTGETLQVTDEATQVSSTGARLFTAEEGNAGKMEFESMQRLVDARDPSYRA
jgi:ribulose-5-phosphate 4-epimerase/fuculose-1-phosphate aldolase